MLPPRPLVSCLVAFALVGCGGGGEPGTGASPAVGPTTSPVAGIPGLDPADLPECAYPESVAMPTWFPDDLPLPPGTYAAERLSAVQGYRRALLIVRRTLDEFRSFVLERFPEAGWVLGRGDTEPGEVDMQFSKAPAVGAFRALDQFCRPGFVLVLVIYAPDRAAIQAPPPITPNPGASPIG